MAQLAPIELTAGEKLIQNQACIDMLQLQQSRLSAELAESDEWDRDGYNSAYDWIRFNCRVNGNVAGDYLSVGVAMASLDHSIGAMAEGDQGHPYVAQFGREIGTAWSKRGTGRGLDGAIGSRGELVVESLGRLQDAAESAGRQGFPRPGDSRSVGTRWRRSSEGD